MESDTGTLMREILELDTNPKIFDVSLHAADNYSSFRAWVSFRGPHQGGRSDEIRAKGDTPEQALQQLKADLERMWGRCPHCGR